MNTQITVPVSTKQFIELANFLNEQGSNREPVEVIATAIDYWMQNASWKPEVLKPEIINTESRGYTWKYKDRSIFLPHGTEIRMPYKGQYHYAKVEGDSICYQGGNVSPSVLANTITKSSRNAWRDLWIKRPGDQEWTLADDIRLGIRRATGDELLAELTAS